MPRVMRTSGTHQAFRGQNNMQYARIRTPLNLNNGSRYKKKSQNDTDFNLKGEVIKEVRMSTTRCEQQSEENTTTSDSIVEPDDSAISREDREGSATMPPYDASDPEDPFNDISLPKNNYKVWIFLES
ncbi:hypothetical protein CRG98_016504 [Punica granatum]|uniref:Uncharacterized protein n=1 Tax=Punica granatum TaxID=22663 RepID=A0A2I0K3J0_PUNGR|nr:hypothetical protein CRG98_016504 [Punica granatum]